MFNLPIKQTNKQTKKPNLFVLPSSSVNLFSLPADIIRCLISGEHFFTPLRSSTSYQIKQDDAKLAKTEG
jgi:hypothetical protein